MSGRTLISYLKEHLVFGTGSRKRIEHIELLDRMMRDGRTGQDFRDFKDWMEERGEFNEDELWNVCVSLAGRYEREIPIAGGKKP